MPSLGETQGHFIQEAKACKRPCVVLKKLGASEAIENGVDGLLVDEQGDCETTCIAFAEAIEWVVSDEAFALRLGERARERALQWTIEDSTRGLLSVLEAT